MVYSDRLLEVTRNAAQFVGQARFKSDEAARYVVAYYNRNRTSIFFAVADNGEVEFVPEPNMVVFDGCTEASVAIQLPVKLFDEAEAETWAFERPVHTTADGWVYHVKVLPLYDYFADVQAHYEEKHELLRLCRLKEDYCPDD